MGKRVRSKENKEQADVPTVVEQTTRSPKIILSRKGTDSASGGLASPIISNHLISFPIPESTHSLIKYSTSKTPIFSADNVQLTYYDLISQLKGEIKIKKSSQKISDLTPCHLDPDIDEIAMSRSSDWTALFGQSGAAATHLHNEGITTGDIFLFFGWFRNTTKNDAGHFAYDRKDKHGRHIIYGFMEIGQVLRIEEDSVVPPWVEYHPHVSVGRSDVNNTIYIANKKATWNNDLPGFGTFSYHDNLVLTKKNCTRSMWNLPNIFRDVDITYHKPSCWKSNYFDSAKRGQEFVVSANTKILDWTKALIKTHLKR